MAAPLGSVTVSERVARYSCAKEGQATTIVKQTRLLLIVRARYQIAKEIAGGARARGGRVGTCGRLVIGAFMNWESFTGRLPIGRRLTICPTDQAKASFITSPDTIVGRSDRPLRRKSRSRD